jgi:GAF domain-containing protein
VLEDDDMVDDSADLTLLEVIRQLLEEPEPPLTLQAIAASAVALLPGCEHAGITLHRRTRPMRTMASTSSLVDDCDTLQRELGEGPCLSADCSSAAYLVADTRNDPRWPAWGSQAAARGAGSLLCVPLYAEDDEMVGSLNLYSSKPNTFTDDDLDTALLYAAHTAPAFAAAHSVGDIHTAPLPTHTVGMAQGILMSRHGITHQHALAALNACAREHGTDLHEVAQLVADSGV